MSNEITTPTENEIKAVLFDFVKRAASEKATTDEVRVLPAVAQALLDTFR